ncbi:MAG TPA: hypothetical protein ENK86_02490 [Campylobacterales bacterium]|nr:hypothetical protein [Campylobacterales bacterium]
MKNLFIVRTPLQLLNALEAKHHFNTQNNILIVIYSVNQTDKAQMDKILNEADWDEIIKLNQGAKKSIFWEYIQTVKELKKESIDKMFLVFFRGVQKLFMSNINAQEIYLIDDGVASLTIQKNLPILIKEKKWLKELRYQLVGLRTDIAKLPNFFTAYDLTPYPDQKIVKNSYKYLVSSFLSQTTEDKQHVYLLGQTLIKPNIVTQDYYLEILKAIKNHFNHQTVIYIPHRDEQLEDLEAIRVLEDQHFIVETSKGAIETEFLENGIYPHYIVSFFTSALFNLEKIFPKSEIYAVKIDSQHLRERKEAVEHCYIELETKSSIKILPL